jgi:hypothetical protein
MQKIIFYHQTPGHIPTQGEVMDHNYDSRYYKSESNFFINPLEDIIIILQNCTNYFFGKGLSLPLTLQNDRFMHNLQPPCQIALWVKNISRTKTLQVYSNSTLAFLLSQHKIICNLCHISIHDLYQLKSIQPESILSSSSDSSSDEHLCNNSYEIKV